MSVTRGAREKPHFSPIVFRIGVALLLSIVAAARDSGAGSTRYLYDDLNRLVRVERPDGIVVSYSYDALGNRLTKKVVHDQDFDDAADAVDNCPNIYNVDQVNADGDSAGNACDCSPTNPVVYPGASQVCDGLNNDCNAPGWPSLAGTNEADNDGDSLSRCQGDCSDTNPLVWFLPAEVSNVGLTGPSPTTLVWDNQGSLVGPETTYDLMSGSLAGGVDFVSGTCMQSAGVTTYSDTRTSPSLGTGYWYLTRGRNSCGVGTYGTIQRDTNIPLCP